MSTKIYVLDSGDIGSPQFSSSDGALIGILDACLVNGYNIKAVTSLVVADEVATLTASAHGFKVGTGKYIALSGADVSALNGDHMIDSVPSGNTLTFAAPGVADGTVTGTMSVKTAPLGWSKPFSSGSTKAVYARSETASSTAMLYVTDHASTGFAKVCGMESVSDINTYSGQFPAVADGSGPGYYWLFANAAGWPWKLIGDGRSFWLLSTSTSFGNSRGLEYGVWFFGDFNSLRPGDAYNCAIVYTNATSWPQFPSGTSYTTGGFGATQSLQRDMTGGQVSTGAEVLLVGGGAPMGGFNNLGSSPQAPMFPSPVDGGMVIDPKVWILEGSTYYAPPIRGFYPGLAQPYASLPASQGGNLVNSAGRQYMIVPTHVTNNSGSCLIDITGPWR